MTQWIMLGAAAAASVADIETTRAALRKGAVEGNDWLYGTHPSGLRLYVVGAGFMGLATLAALAPDPWAACIVSGVLVALRTFAAISNALLLRRL